MFNERNIQQQLQNFQQKSKIEPQQITSQQQSQCPTIQQVPPMQQHYQPQYSGAVASTAAAPAGSLSTVNWYTQQPQQVHCNQQQHVQPKPTGEGKPKGASKSRSIVLPQWLSEAVHTSNGNTGFTPKMAAVREVYTRALGLVECIAGGWVDTNRVSLLLLRTGVPAGVLAVLWELVNCTKLGHLTRDECAALLALIALVQAGESLVSPDVLQHLTEPVVPLIDHPALMPFMQQYQQHNVASTDNTDDEFADFVSPSLFPNNNNANAFDTNVKSGVAGVNNATLHAPAEQQPVMQQPSSLAPPNSVDKRMNLPQVGCSPDMSPSLSFDNSQEEDFDDFQSATSDPSGLVSSDGSPRSATVQCEESSSGITSDHNTEPNSQLFGAPAKTTASNAAFSTFSNAPSASFATASLQVGNKNKAELKGNGTIDAFPANDVPFQSNVADLLQPNKVAMHSDDKYAAFRDLSSADDELPNSLQEQENVQFNQMKPDTEDDSFGEFCSVSKCNEDDGFGDFAGAFPSVPPVKAVPAHQYSAPDINVEQSPLDSPAISNTLHSNFQFNNFNADFTSLNLKDSNTDHRDFAPVTTPSLPIITPISTFATDAFSDVTSKPDNSSQGIPFAAGGVMPDIITSTNNTSHNDISASHTVTSTAHTVASTAHAVASTAHAVASTAHAVASTAHTVASTVHAVTSTVHAVTTTAHTVTTTAHTVTTTAHTVTTTAHAVNSFSVQHSSGANKGNADWSNFFGEFGETISQPAQLPVESMVWREEPPPLPADGSGEEEEDFGEFFSTDTLAASDSAQLQHRQLHQQQPEKLQHHHQLQDQHQDLEQDQHPPPRQMQVYGNVAAALSSISEPLTSLDKYSSIREARSLSAESCWQRCLQGAITLLSGALLSLTALPQMDGDKLADARPWQAFVAGVVEVLLVCCRLRCACRQLPGAAAALQPSLDSVAEMQDSMAKALDRSQKEDIVVYLKGVEQKIPTYSPNQAAEDLVVCGVCLTVIVSPDSGKLSAGKCTDEVASTTDSWHSSQCSGLEYGGHSYHPTCANLWLNCVDLTLPALTTSSLTLL